MQNACLFVASQCQLGAQYGAREGLERCKLGSNIDSEWANRGEPGTKVLGPERVANHLEAIVGHR